MMKTEITITRFGSAGYPHEVPVLVSFPGPVAMVARDVLKMKETNRYGETEWQATFATEWRRGESITLTTTEAAQAWAVIGENRHLLREAKEQLR